MLGLNWRSGTILRIYFHLSCWYLMLHPLDPDILFLSIRRSLRRHHLRLHELRRKSTGILLQLRSLLLFDIRYLHELLLQGLSTNWIGLVLLPCICKQLLYLLIVKLLFELLVVEYLLQHVHAFMDSFGSNSSGRRYVLERETNGWVSNQLQMLIIWMFGEILWIGNAIVCQWIFLHHVVVGLLQLLPLINLLLRDDLVKFGVTLRADWAHWFAWVRVLA